MSTKHITAIYWLTPDRTAAPRPPSRSGSEVGRASAVSARPASVEKPKERPQLFQPVEPSAVDNGMCTRLSFISVQCCAIDMIAQRVRFSVDGVNCEPRALSSAVLCAHASQDRMMMTWTRASRPASLRRCSHSIHTRDYVLMSSGPMRRARPRRMCRPCSPAAHRHPNLPLSQCHQTMTTTMMGSLQMTVQSSTVCGDAMFIVSS